MTAFKMPPMELLDLGFHAKVWPNSRRETDGPAKKSNLLHTMETHLFHTGNLGVVPEVLVYTEVVGRTAVQLFNLLCLERKLPENGFPQFISECWYRGLKNGRNPFCWTRMAWDKQIQGEKVAKALRHLSKVDNSCYSITEQFQHLAAVFCNSNIIWYNVKHAQNNALE